MAAATACPGTAQLCDGATISVQTKPYIPRTLYLIPSLHSLHLTSYITFAWQGLHITCNRLGLGRAVVQAVMARKKLHISLWAGASKCWQVLAVFAGSALPAQNTAEQTIAGVRAV